jgi:hypothetical protein
VGLYLLQKRHGAIVRFLNPSEVGLVHLEVSQFIFVPQSPGFFLQDTHIFWFCYTSSVNLRIFFHLTIYFLLFTAAKFFLEKPVKYLDNSVIFC